MLIIDKRKDYYDYLTGIYGIDKKLVLDRRIVRYPYLSYSTAFSICICGIKYSGYYDGKSYYYGEDLIPLGKFIPISKWNNSARVVINPRKGLLGTQYVEITPSKLSPKYNLNEIHNCPIVLCEGSNITLNPNYHFNFPNLKDFNFASVIPAEELFKQLTDWLSSKITEQELINDTRSDAQKANDKGFDPKRSFRPKIKY